MEDKITNLQFLWILCKFIPLAILMIVKGILFYLYIKIFHEQQDKNPSPARDNHWYE